MSSRMNAGSRSSDHIQEQCDVWLTVKGREKLQDASKKQRFLKFPTEDRLRRAPLITMPIFDNPIGNVPQKQSKLTTFFRKKTPPSTGSPQMKSTPSEQIIGETVRNEYPLCENKENVPECTTVFHNQLSKNTSCEQSLEVNQFERVRCSRMYDGNFMSRRMGQKVRSGERVSEGDVKMKKMNADCNGRVNATPLNNLQENFESDYEETPKFMESSASESACYPSLWKSTKDLTSRKRKLGDKFSLDLQRLKRSRTSSQDVPENQEPVSRTHLNAEDAFETTNTTQNDSLSSDSTQVDSEGFENTELASRSVLGKASHQIVSQVTEVLSSHVLDETQDSSFDFNEEITFGLQKLKSVSNKTSNNKVSMTSMIDSFQSGSQALGDDMCATIENQVTDVCIADHSIETQKALLYEDISSQNSSIGSFHTLDDLSWNSHPNPSVCPRKDIHLCNSNLTGTHSHVSFSNKFSNGPGSVRCSSCNFTDFSPIISQINSPINVRNSADAKSSFL